MFKKANANFVIKIISVLILTLLFSGSFFFDTAGPPRAFAADNIFTDNIGIGTTNPARKLHVYSGPSSASSSSVADVLIEDSTPAVLQLLTASGQYNAIFLGDTGTASSAAIGSGTTTALGELDFRTGGTGGANTRILITSGGNVGIGTTNPGNYKLYVNGDTYIGGVTVTNGALSFGGNLDMRGYDIINTSNIGIGTSNPGTASLAVMNGNVGIGTTNPTAKLDVDGSSYFRGTLDMTNNRVDSIGDLYFDDPGATEGIGWSGTSAGWLIDVSPENRTNNDGDLNFYGTANNIVAWRPFKTKQATWLATDSGNVGIGTTAPSSLLHVNGIGKISGNLILDKSSGLEIDFSSTTSHPMFQFRKQSDPAVAFQTYSAGGQQSRLEITTGTTAEVDIKLANLDLNGNNIYSSSGNLNLNDQVYISGNVGIGTTSPSQTLEVNGTTRFGNWSSWGGQGTITWDGGKSSTFNILGTSGKGVSIGSNGVYDRLYMDTSGNVGIGTTLPGSKLDVNGAGIFTALGVSIGGADATLSLTSSSTGNPTIYLNAPGSQGELKILVDNADSDNVKFRVHDGSVVDDTDNVMVMYPATQDIQIVNDLGIGYADTGTAKLAVNGNVGIGTTGPGYKLEVNGSSYMGGTHFIAGETILNSSNRISLRNSANNAETWLDNNGASGESLFSIFTNSTERLTIKNDGNVGIGTTNPGSYKLYVNGDTYIGGVVVTNGALSFGGNLDMKGYDIINTSNVGIGTSNPGTAALAVMNGNVGIGTTAPSQLLHVKGDDKGLRIEDGSAVVYYDIHREDSTGYLRFFGNQGSPYSGYKFLVNNGPEAMRIDSSGNVGIGTTNPALGKLQVDGIIFANGNELQTNSRIRLGSAGDLSTTALYKSDDTNTGINWPAADTLGLVTGGGYRLYIKSDGNVGIGTTSPGAKLHVSGGTILLDNNQPLQWKDTGGTARNILLMNSSDNLFLQQPLTNKQLYIDSGTTAANATDYAILFRTNNAADAATTRLAIGAGANTVDISFLDSNVGIGTSTPGYKLDVSGDINLAATSNYIRWNGLVGSAHLRPDVFYMGGDNLSIQSWSGSAVVDRMKFIASTGNVGIGTTNPVDTLDVVGTVGIGTITLTSSNAAITGVNEIEVAAVSAENDPSYTFTGDADTGMYAPSANVLGFSTGGTEKVRIDSSGNVGIGTTNPGSYKLYVNGDTYIGGVTVTNGALSFGGDLNMKGYDVINTSNIGIGTSSPGTAALAVIGGNVGIGTTNPGAALAVGSDAFKVTSAGVVTAGTWNGSAIGTGYLASTVMLEGENISLLNNNSGYITASSTDTLTNKTWNGVSIGTGYTAAKDTTDDSWSGTGNITMTSGNVGIGTASPGNYRLNVSGDEYVSGKIVGDGWHYRSNSTGSNEFWGGTNNTGDGAGIATRGANQAGYEGLINFYTPNAAKNGIVERLRINSLAAQGAAGIISYEPLTVNGTANVTGELTVGSGGVGGLHLGNAWTIHLTGGELNLGWTNSRINFRINQSYNYPMTILSNGNVGIGAVSPVGLLQAGSGPTPGLIVTGQNGNVGIGTTNPGAALAVGSDAFKVTSAGVVTAGTWNGSAIGTGYLASTVMLEGENISLLNNNSGYITASSTDTLTNKTWNGVSIGTGYTAAKDTTDDSWSGTGNITMTSGNVGIGTAGPGNTLHVEKARSDTISSAAAAYRLGGSDVYLFGGSKSSGSYAVWMQAFRPSDDAAFPLVLNPNGGNVGIGTTGPVAKLDVLGDMGVSISSPARIVAKLYQTGSDGQLELFTGNNPPISRIRLDSYGNSYFTPSAGNVGIGLTNPSVKLHTAGGSDVALTGATGYLITGDSAAQHIAIDDNEIMSKSNATTAGTLYLQNEGGTVQIGSNLTVNGTVGGTGFSGWDTNASDDFTASSTLTGLVRSTAAGNSWITGGNVGIGTTAPATPLAIKIPNSSIANLDLLQDDSAADGWRFKTISGGSLYFLRHWGANEYNRMVITAGSTDNTSGAVGIGTTDPQGRLELVSDGTATSLGFFTSTYDPVKQWGTRMYKSDTGGGIPLIIENQQTSTWFESARLSHGQDNKHPSLQTGYRTFLAITGGSVGIGTTNPLQKLQVAGDINIESGYGIRINNTATSGQYLRGNGTQFVSAAIAAGDLPSSIDAAKIANGTITNTEFQYLDNLSNNIQTQLDGKLSASGTLTGLVQSTLAGVNYFNGGGNVGIGTTNPQAALDVGGNFKVTSAGAVTGASGNISMWTNNSGYITASSTDTLTNKSGNISMWTNNSGYITSSGSITGDAGTLLREDNRTISPSELTAGRLKFGFTSWANNDTSPYADFLHLRSYTDASGGTDNLVMFKKSGIGMRIWQQTYGSATAYATYKDVALSGDNISIFNNDSGYITASSTNTLTNKSGNISMWTNNSGYITASSTDTLTNKTWNGVSIGTGYTAAKDTTDDSWSGTGNITMTSGNVGIGTATPGTANLAVMGGNVGIGTTNPQYALDVNGDARISGSTLIIAGTCCGTGLQMNNRAITGVDSIAFNDTNEGITWAGGNTNIREMDAGYLSLYDTNAIALEGSNVGIGTTNPLQKLQVAGDINIESGSGIRINNGATLGQYLRGDSTRFVSAAIAAGDLPSSIDAVKIANGSISNTEFQYLDGVTSAIQTQLNGKQATITGGATTITSSNLTVSRALVSDGSGKVAVSGTTSAELGYVSGVTSAIQTQLNGKLSSGGTLTGLVQSNTAGTSYFTGGNLGIGTATPGTANLAVMGGNVGIGTTSPATKLEVNGDWPTIQVKGTSGTQNATFKAITPADGNVAFLALQRNAGTYQSYWELRTPENSTDLGIYTSASPAGDRVRIKTDGNVGIGTAGPAQKLEISNGNIILHRMGPDGSYYLGLGGGDGSIVPAVSGGSQIEFEDAINGVTDEQRIHFLVHRSGVFHNRVMSIVPATSGGGNVGIGLTNPAQALHVAGNVLLSSGNQFMVRYDAGDNYRSSLNWNGLQLGNNGDNVIIGGRTNTNGNLKFYVNNTTDFPTAPNGILALTLASNGNATFGGTITASGGNSGNWNTAYTHSQAATGAEHGATSSVSANMIVRRDANGYIFGNYFNSSDDISTGTLTYLMGKFGDNYYRSATAAKVKTFLGLEAGGSGDIWVEKAGDTMTGQLVLGASGLNVDRSQTSASIWFAAPGTDTNHVLWNDYYGGPTTRGAAGSGWDGMKWNAYNGLQIRTGSAGATERLIIDGPNNRVTFPNGNVGIGTASPVSKLEVANSSAGSFTEVLKLFNSDTTSQASSVGLNFANGYVGETVSLAKIRGYVGQPANNGGALDFITRNGNGGSYTTVMTLFDNSDGTGKVGIGTTGPISNLHVSGTNPSVLTLGLASPSADGVINLPYSLSINIDSDNNAADTQYFVIGKNAAGRTPQDGGTVLFKVQENGNVGIGNTNPVATLHVGTPGATKSVIIDGSLQVNTGPKSAAVPTSKGMRLLYSVEAADSRFEDFGNAQLINGEVEIRLDSLFLETITISDKYPMIINLTLTSDSPGLYVAKKTNNSFVVKEIQGGKGNPTFDYRITAMRKGFENRRLELALQQPSKK